MTDVERTGLEIKGHVWVLPDIGSRVCTFGCRNGQFCGYSTLGNGRTQLHCRMDAVDREGKPIPPTRCERCKTAPAIVLIRPVGADTPVYVDGATAPFVDLFLCADCANWEMDT